MRRLGAVGKILWIGACAWSFVGVTAAQTTPRVDLAAGQAAISEDVPAQSQAPAVIAIEEAALRRDLALHPDSPEILYKLALILRQEDRPKESLEIYTRAAQFQKPSGDQLHSVALDYVLLNDYEDAIRWLQVAATTDPANTDVLYSLGRCLYTQGRYGDAINRYLQVLRLQPKHLRAEENLGLAYDASNDPEKAEEALRKAASWAGVEATDEWPFLNLGVFLLDRDRAGEAVSFLERAVAMAPKSAVGHEKLGRALEGIGKLADAVKELGIASGLDPRNPNLHFELGHAYREIGELEKARAEFATSQALRKERDTK